MISHPASCPWVHVQHCPQMSIGTMGIIVCLLNIHPIPLYLGGIGNVSKWGNYESRNGMERGTERGTEVRCGPRAGLPQKSVKCLFQCRTEAKHTYLFTKVACIACFRVFPRVGRGQRSRAYLISFNEKVRRAFIYRRHRTPAFC